MRPGPAQLPFGWCHASLAWMDFLGVVQLSSVTLAVMSCLNGNDHLLHKDTEGNI